MFDVRVANQKRQRNSRQRARNKREKGVGKSGGGEGACEGGGASVEVPTSPVEQNPPGKNMLCVVWGSLRRPNKQRSHATSCLLRFSPALKKAYSNSYCLCLWV